MVSLTVDGKELVATPHYSNRASGSSVYVDNVGELKDYYHYHPEYQLQFSQDLGGKRVIGNIVEDCNGLDIVLLGPKLPHAWLSNGSPAQENPSQVVTAFFTRESIGVELLSKSELRPVRHLLDDARRGITFSAADLDDETLEKILLLPELSASQQFFCCMHILDLLARNVSWTPLLTEDYDLSWAENDEILFQKIQQYIWDNHSEPFGRNDIAEYVGLSVSSFSRLLKRMTNKTFVEYLNEFRIQRACNLIRNGSEPIYEIGFKVGFRNSSYFNKQFKALMKMTPSTYRNTQTTLNAKIPKQCY